MIHCGIKIFDTYKEIFDYNATVQVHLGISKNATKENILTT